MTDEPDMPRLSDRLVPRVVRGETVTVAGHLGHLNSVHCPRCNHFLFAYYDRDMLRHQAGVQKEMVDSHLNYCLECGQRLDLSEYKCLGDAE